MLDTSVFASHDRGLGWIWNDLTMCFNSPPAAANIDNNCFYAELDANQPVGETVKINVPAQFPIQVFGQVYIADQQEAGYCQLDVVVHDNNRYQVKGCNCSSNKTFWSQFCSTRSRCLCGCYYSTSTKTSLASNLQVKWNSLKNHSKGKNSPSIYLNHCLSYWKKWWKNRITRLPMPYLER